MGDGMRLNRAAYAKLVDENVAWLMKQPMALERDHLALIAICSVGWIYETEPGDHEWFASATTERERCARCMMTRSFAGAWNEYTTAHGRYVGVVTPAPPCVPLARGVEAAPQTSAGEGKGNGE